MGSLLAVYDPSGKLGLTDPSPGGGEVPLRWRCSVCGHITERRSKDGTCWQRAGWAAVWAPCGGGQMSILLLRTEDGTPDPVGTARAREVLALNHPCLHTPEDVARGVWFFRGHVADYDDSFWIVQTPGERTAFAAIDPGETAPEALARLLSAHVGVEVIRG